MRSVHVLASLLCTAHSSKDFTTAPFRRRSLFRRLLPFLIVACLAFLLLVFVLDGQSWRQLVGVGSYGPAEGKRAHAKAFKEPKIESTSPYPVGKTKPPGSNYTKTLVIPRLKSENTSWIEEELGDLIGEGILSTAVYTVDDRKAKLHPPKNKGHEVMVYLTYIIDHYESLSDVSIFMHAHRFAWHNNELMDTDASKMVRHLSPERVTREGYMNLRCHWNPGCPAWLHPSNTVRNPNKQEEELLAECWSELFPMTEIPTVVAQPCCAQFAVSRERIWEMNKMRYIYLRDWLIRTDLTDYLSGRIFEYTWQYIFSAAPIHCPSMSACYCDGYGVCFGDAQRFDYWFELRYNVNELKDKLRIWEEKASKIEKARGDGSGGMDRAAAVLAVPEAGKDEELKQGIAEIEREMESLLEEAWERGKDPRQRAIESGREWMEGDGY